MLLAKKMAEGELGEASNISCIAPDRLKCEHTMFTLLLHLSSKENKTFIGYITQYSDDLKNEASYLLWC